MGNNPLVETTYTLPRAFPHLAHLSDLHGRDYHPVVESLLAHRPSIICITGDIIYGSPPVDDISHLDAQPNVLPFLSACSSIAPTYLSLGNHERMLDETDIHTIGSTGVTVLDNRYVTTAVDGTELVIGGLTSPYCLEYRKFRASFYNQVSQANQSGVENQSRYPKWVLQDGVEKHSKHDMKPRYTPDTSWLADFASTPGFHILLSHHPEYTQLIPPSIDLILSSHAHSGQWRIYNPFKRELVAVFAPGQGWWPKLTEGVHEVLFGSSSASGSSSSHTTLIISRGLTNTAKIPRFFNRPEVVYISGAGNNCDSENYNQP